MLVACSAFWDRIDTLELIRVISNYDFKRSYALFHAFAPLGCTSPSTVLWLIERGCCKTPDDIPTSAKWQEVRLALNVSTPAASTVTDKNSFPNLAEMNKELQRLPVPKVLCFTKMSKSNEYLVRTDAKSVSCRFIELFPKEAAAGFNNVMYRGIGDKPAYLAWG